MLDTYRARATILGLALEHGRFSGGHSKYPQQEFAKVARAEWLVLKSMDDGRCGLSVFVQRQR